MAHSSISSSVFNKSQNNISKMTTLHTILAKLLFLGLVASSPPLQVDVSSTFEESAFHAGPSPDLFAGVRLSQDIVPIHYDLTIRPIVSLPMSDPQQFTAPGVVTIRIRAVNPTNNITLHANDISIDYDNVQVMAVSNGSPTRVLTHSNSTAMSTYTALLEAQLTTNAEYNLIIPFVAKVGDRLSGLYRSSYKDSQGNQKWLATTQFQKLGARMAFPCFDEPNFKSTFNITIGRPAGYHSLTNAPLLVTVPNTEIPNWFWDIHTTTVKMSTYLIAIIISDFASVNAPAGISNYDVKVWGPPTITNASTALFAATSAGQIVSFFETYLQSPFQFSKLDSVAVPDFSAGAMENWALNTYRLNYLLFIDGESTQNDKWGIARVFAHEISHHWFGDLVTCDWWNDLWLNEGFASYMELLAANATGFDVDAMDRYPLDKHQVAMAFDVGPNSEPIHSDNLDIVNSQASTIIYQKGASLIKTMTGFLTEATFIGGIRNYLDKHAYSNTNQDDLFAELTAQAQLDGTLMNYTVKQVMDTWTRQTGFPLVSIVWFPDHVLFRHEVFSLNPPAWDDTATQAAGTWYTPISFTLQSNSDFSETGSKPQFWFEPGQQNVSTLLPVAADEWAVVNPDARSYFRTIYCPHFLTLIIRQLEANNTVISAKSRGQIIDDLFKTVFTKGWENAQMKDALNITKYLHQEDNTAVWITVFNNLRPINRYLIDTPFYLAFKDYVLSKLTPALDRIGWEQSGSEAPKTTILRTQLLDWACSLGAPQCYGVTESYAIGLANGTSVPADLQPVIYCNAVSISESLNLPGQFNITGYLLTQYEATTKDERFSVFINSLACDSLDNVQRWLDLLTSASNPFTSSHTTSFLQRLAENSANRPLLLSYFATNLQRIISALGESSISNLVTSIAGYTSEAQLAVQVNTFIDAALEVVTSANVRNSLNASRGTLVDNTAWVADWGQKIGVWLQG